jgi:hypothetical protein
MSQYLFIKDNTVQNIVSFVEPSDATLELFKTNNGLDAIVEFEDYINIGDGFVNGARVPKKPFEGWVLSEDGTYYLPPTNKPSEDHVWSDEDEDWVLPA